MASQGLVTIAPRAGIYVARPSTAELVALLECLAEFEAVAARLAAQRMDALTREQLRAADETAAQYAQDQDRAGYEPANQVFHDLIYRGSGNPIVAEQIRAVRRRLAAFRRRVLDQPGRLQVSRRDHQAITEAILAGDPDRAAAAMREHILAKGKAVADLVLVATV